MSSFYELRKKLLSQTQSEDAKKQWEEREWGEDTFLGKRKALLQQGEEIDKPKKDALSQWINQYNTTMQGISDYDKKRNGGYTQDVSGGFSADVDSLISGFGNISAYADRLGLENSQQYLQALKDLQSSIAQQNAYYAQFADENAYNSSKQTQKQTFLQDPIAATMGTEAHTAAPISGTEFTAMLEKVKPYLGQKPSNADIYEYLDTLSAVGLMDAKTKTEYDAYRTKYGENTALNYSLLAVKQLIKEKEKELADYLASDEYRQAEEEYADAVSRGTANFQLAFSTDKQNQLETEIQQYKKQEKAFSEQKTVTKDLATIENWPEEDREMLTSSSITEWPAAFLKLSKKYGAEKVRNLYETYQRQKNADRMASATEFAKEHGGLGDSIFGIPIRIVGGVAGTLDYLGQGLGKLLGIDSGRYGLDTNTIWQIPSAFGSELIKADTEEVGQWAGSAAEAHGGGEKAQKVASDIATTVYGAGVNAVENLTRVVATGGYGSLALAATSSFQDGVTSATKQGATPMEAIGMGLASAAFETITEKIPLDDLLSSVKKAGSGGWGNVVLKAFKQAGIEVTTEEANFLGTTLAEAMILKEKSSYNQMISELVANGMPYDEAKKKADKALLEQAGQIAIQTALSGAMSSVGFTYINNKGGSFTGNTDQSQQNQQNEQGENDISEVIDRIFANGQVQQQAQTGEQTEGDTIATPHQVTTEPQQGAPGGKLTSEDLTDIIDEAVAKRHGAPADPIAAALESIANGETVTNKQAQDIMNNTRAVQRLVQEAGLTELNGTDSKNLTAVKDAVLRLSQQQTTVDTAANTNYDNIDNTQGGNIYAQPEAGNTTSTGTFSANDDFAGIQAESRRTSFEDIQQQGLSTEDNESVRVRLAKALGGELERRGLRNGNDDGLHLTSGNGQTFDMMPVDAKAFHDIFEVARKYTKNGELVDLHGVETTEDSIGYNDCKNYLSSDGMSGFSITPEGDLISVFNAHGAKKKGFLRAIAPFVKANAKTLDCYMSELQPLHTIYEKVFGMKVASVMDHNMLFDRDSIAANHNRPKVAFMVNTDENVTTKFFGENDYAAAQDYRDSFIKQNDNTQKPTESVGAATGGSYGDNTVGSAQSRFTHTQKESKLYKNTYKNAKDEAVRAVGEEAKMETPDIAKYDTISERESLHNAELRTRTPEEMDYECEYLISKNGWSGEDADTAMRVLDYLRTNSDATRFRELSKKQRAEFTAGGQLIQSAAKYSRTPTNAAQDAMDALDALKQSDVPRKFYKKNGFEAWKNDVAKSVLEVTNSLASVEDGDASAVKDIIRSLANFRKTTAWFGLKSNLTKIAESALKDVDFEEAKDIAMAQIRQIPGDFQKRTVGEVTKTIRIHNMLAALTTVNRNLAGNASIGVVDALSDSTVGRGLDALVSLATKKRTVGNDVTHAKTYFTAGAKAARKAALCAELDIPMESESRYSTGSTRTFSPQGGPVTRFLSAYDKAMRYALEVTDKFFEGGTSAAVDQSLQNLGTKANLTEKEKSEISNLVGRRRTFKDDRMMTRAARKVKEGLNEIGSGNIGLGDLTMPFAATGTNVGHTAIDYTSGGLFGFVDILRLMNDVRTGKYENGEKVIYDRKTGKAKRKISLVEAQRQAVTNAARGLTGTGLIAAFTALAATGILGVHDDEDKDKRGLDQSLNLSGAQLNISAALRALTGGSTEWQDGDWTLSVDFLEPFNAQMYLGYLLSKEDSVQDMAASYPENAVKGVFQSLLDMPLMQNLEDTANLITSIGEADDLQDAAGQIIGNTASGFIPSWLRQTAQVIDPYYRDTTGQSVLEKSINQVIATIPGLSKTLPKKYSGLGDEQLRYDGIASGIFNTFVNPGELEQIKTSEIATFLDGLYESTGKKSIYPESAAPGNFSYDGKTVTVNGKEMTETYQRTYGENVNWLYSALMESGNFLALSDDLQAEALKAANTYATQLARAAVSDYSEVLSYIRDRPDGLSETDAIIIHIAENCIDDAFDDVVDSWKTGNGSDAAISRLDQAYKTFQNLSADMQKSIIANAGGKLEYYLTAKDAGVSTSTFARVYKAFYDIDKSGAKTGEKAAQWSYELEKFKENGTLTAAQKDALKAEMNFWQMIPAGTKRFDDLTKSGLDADTSAYVVDLIMGIQPLPGNSGVKDYQKAKAITGADDKLTEEQQKIVLKNYLDEKSYAKYLDILKLGLDNDEYAAACELYALEKDIGGKGTKERTILKFMKEFLISHNVATALYEIYNPK